MFIVNLPFFAFEIWQLTIMCHALEMMQFMIKIEGHA